METGDKQVLVSLQELNRRLKAPVQAFFSHLCEVVQPCLTGSDEGLRGSAAQISLVRHNDQHISVRLKSELAGLPFYWDFHCSPAPSTVVRRCVTSTRVSLSSASLSDSRCVCPGVCPAGAPPAGHEPPAAAAGGAARRLPAQQGCRDPGLQGERSHAQPGYTHTQRV